MLGYSESQRTEFLMLAVGVSLLLRGNKSWCTTGTPSSVCEFPGCGVIGVSVIRRSDMWISCSSAGSQDNYGLVLYEH